MTFFLYKLAGSLVTPPGLLVVILFLLALQAFRWPKRILLGTELLLFAFCLYALSAPATSRRLVGPLETVEASLPEAGREAAVVVLAAGLWRGDEEVELKPHSLQRLVGGWEVARQRGWPLILAGGSLAEGGKSAAAAMADRLARWGHTGIVIVEDRSRTTWENLSEAALILKERGLSDVVLVTHAYHMERSLLSAAKALPEADLHPFPVGRLADGKGSGALDWLPDAGALFQSLIALRERLGLIAYRLFLK